LKSPADSIPLRPDGYFNFADSYFVAGKRLSTTKFKTTHPDSPARLLFHFTLELYLKSFLILRGEDKYSVQGHKLVELGKKAKIHGLSYSDATGILLINFDSLNTVITSRYFRAQYIVGGEPSFDEILVCCAELRAEVVKHFRASGTPVGDLRDLWKEKS
jgi:hypothetical protein